MAIVIDKNSIIMLVRLYIVHSKYSIAFQNSTAIVIIVLKTIQFKLSNLLLLANIGNLLVMLIILGRFFIINADNV